MQTVYLDHAATTPLDPEVRLAMEPYLEADFGNPSSVHRLGQRARMAVDRAREKVAAALNADRFEIFFTSGGTESDNSAIRGVAFAAQAKGKHIVTTSIEHEAVLETCDYLAGRHGFDVTVVDPGRDGVVAVETVANALRPETTLVSVMFANNEIGTVQPIERIGRLCRDRGVIFHVDGVQAAGMITVDVRRQNIDLLSISAHKFHGPKGVGALFVRRQVAWWAQQMGGGQERGRRSGTENVAGMVGMGEALELGVAKASKTADRLTLMRDALFDAILAGVPGAVANGSRAQRLPGNVNVSFPGISGESLVMALDAQGVMASSGSACSSGSVESSHVLRAIGCSPDVADGALRLTLGRENTWDEINESRERIIRTVLRLQHHRVIERNAAALV